MIFQGSIKFDIYSRESSLEKAKEDFFLELTKRGMLKEATYILQNNIVMRKRYFIGNSEFTIYGIKGENIFALHLKVTFA